jgi:hypothetical protein
MTEVERLAGWFKRAGLQDIAAFLFEFGKPFGFLGAQGAYLMEPLFGRRILRDLARVLEDPERMDAVIAELAREEGRDE